MIKRTLVLSLAVLATVGSVAMGQSAINDQVKLIQEHANKREFDQAVNVAETALKTEGLTPADKVRLLRTAAESVVRQGKAGYGKAIELYQRVIADQTVPNNLRIESLNSIANVQVLMLSGVDLRQMDLSQAHSTLAGGLAWPGLKPDERAVILRHIARLHERADEFDLARKQYDEIVQSDASAGAKKEAWRLLADTLATQGKNSEAVAIYQQNGLDMIAIYQKIGDDKARESECRKVLDNPQSTDPQRWTAFTRLPCWDWRNEDAVAVRAAVDQYLPSFLEKDENRVLHLRRKFELLGVEKKNHAFAAWAAPLIAKSPRLSDEEYAKIKSAELLAVVALGDAQAAHDLAGTLVSDNRLSASTRYWAQIVAATFRTGDSFDATKATDGAKDLPAKEQADAILLASRTAMLAGRESQARALYAEYERRWPKAPRGTISCAFVERAPFDVGGWMNSPLRKAEAGKARIDRPYGDNLQFLLETDSAITGRNTTAQKDGAGNDEQPTDFHIAADAEGLHLFFLAYDPQATDVVAGMASGGAFEMYLAPGRHQAYLTLVSDLPAGQIDPNAFITMYDNRQFRLPSIADGTIRSQTAPVEGGFGSYVFLSWETFYDKLPEAGTKWQFEAIRWTRAGGLTFGGSESVHHRSSWGDIVFDAVSAEQLNAIKRRIVFKAVNKYRAAKGLLGPVGHWSDPILGDPEFYAAEVAPMIERLDNAVRTVNKDLSSADVDKLFVEAVPEWMELQHIVAAKRSQYLQKKLLAAE